MKEIKGQRDQLPKIQLKLMNPAGKDSPGIENTCKALLDVAEARRLTVLANEYLRQTAQKFNANFFEPYVSDTGRKNGMTREEREEANRLIERWKLDREAPDFASVDPIVKTKLNALFSQFDAMKAAAAAADAHARAVANHAEKMKALTSTVIFVRQAPAKWKRASGKDIFNSTGATWTGGYGQPITISLSDDAGQPPPLTGSVTIDTGGAGERQGHSGGATLYFQVRVNGEKPLPVPDIEPGQKGPRKAPIREMLTSPAGLDLPAPPAPTGTSTTAPENMPAPTPAPPKGNIPSKRPVTKKGR